MGVGLAENVKLDAGADGRSGSGAAGFSDSSGELSYRHRGTGRQIGRQTADESAGGV
jgi:hypothetical protein